MKNRLNWIAQLLIGVNVLLTLAIIIFLIYGLEPGYTGPIGDTFGGLLSPAIGVISIIFIYKTFAAQREQLEDQKNANKSTVYSVYAGLSYKNGQVAVSPTFVVATLQNHDYRSLPTQNYHFLSTP